MVITPRNHGLDLPVMIVFWSYASTVHTLPWWPSITTSHSHLPTLHNLAVESQLPLTIHPASGHTSIEQTL